MKGYIGSVKRPKRANDALYGCKKVEETFWFCGTAVKDSVFKAVE